MPVQIGQAEPGFDDPVGLMTACHRRIKNFLKTLRIAAELAEQRDLEPEELEAVSRALHYFRDAAPNHTADEEQDVFPALLRHEPSSTETVEALLRDHHRADALHQQVNDIGEVWLREGRIQLARYRELVDALTQLEGLYAEHIRTEETELFPRASQVLSRAEFTAIGVKMAERRGMRYEANHAP